MSNDLMVWLRAQLAEDECLAALALAESDRPKWEAYNRRPGEGEPYPLWEIAGPSADGFGDRAASAQHAARHDPARVLAEVDAKRRILAEHAKADYRNECRRCFDPDTAPGDYDFEWFPCPTLRALALPYADRPGYRQEWAP